MVFSHFTCPVSQDRLIEGRVDDISLIKYPGNSHICQGFEPDRILTRSIQKTSVTETHESTLQSLRNLVNSVLGRNYYISYNFGQVSSVLNKWELKKNFGKMSKFSVSQG